MKNTSIVSLSQNEIFAVSGGLHVNIISSIIAGVGIIGSSIIAGFSAKDKKDGVKDGVKAGLFALATTGVVTACTFLLTICFPYPSGKNAQTIFNETYQKTAIGSAVGCTALELAKKFFSWWK